MYMMFYRRKPQRPVRLILAEDSGFNVTDFTRKLRNWRRPHEMWVAKDGQFLLDGLVKRLDLAPDQLPDLIVLDLHMPRVGGIEVLANLRQHHLLTKIPVVVWTMSHAPFDTEQTEELGIDGYLMKNGNAATMIRALDRVLDSQQAA
ncbi:MAG: response regulator [Pseudomonadota bacterium]